ncbi:MAG: hypothetical protein RBT71_04550 [Flavobacteriales bacterium]|jgi:hypothetical protein|nr:hypothetical protein [Flavobacteriales bacterium]
MTSTEAFHLFGSTLQERYKALGFKYRKSDKVLLRRSGDFEYLVIMYSTRGNKEGVEVSLHVDLAIKCWRPVPDTDRTVGQLFYVRLLTDEHVVYNIATEALLAQAIADLVPRIDTLLVPFIAQLEDDPQAHADTWVREGCFGGRKGYGFVTNLLFMSTCFGRQQAQDTLHHFIHSLAPAVRENMVDVLAGRKPESELVRPSSDAIRKVCSDALLLGLQAPGA